MPALPLPSRVCGCGRSHRLSLQIKASQEPAGPVSVVDGAPLSLFNAGKPIPRRGPFLPRSCLDEIIQGARRQVTSLSLSFAPELEALPPGWARTRFCMCICSHARVLVC